MTKIDSQSPYKCNIQLLRPRTQQRAYNSELVKLTVSYTVQVKRTTQKHAFRNKLSSTNQHLTVSTRSTVEYHIQRIATFAVITITNSRNIIKNKVTSQAGRK